MPDYYSILGIGRNASEEEVKKAYKALAKKWHPDKNPNNQEVATKKFKEVSEAYQILGDSAKRKEYDRSGGMNSSKQSSSRNRQYGGNRQHEGNGQQGEAGGGWANSGDDLGSQAHKRWRQKRGEPNRHRTDDFDNIFGKPERMGNPFDHLFNDGDHAFTRRRTRQVPRSKNGMRTQDFFHDTFFFKDPEDLFREVFGARDPFTFSGLHNHSGHPHAHVHTANFLFDELGPGERTRSRSSANVPSRRGQSLLSDLDEVESLLSSLALGNINLLGGLLGPRARVARF